ncbi:MAG: hypothetical protein J6A68_04025 [Oscillospiraceae bacterium]|nr:hypothetical protein [Oscillospiraceae bacterium]
MKTHIDRFRAAWKKNGILFLKAIVLLLSLFKLLSTFFWFEMSFSWSLFFADYSFLGAFAWIAFGDLPHIWNIVLFIALIIELIIPVPSLILVPFKKKKVSSIGLIGLLILNIPDAIITFIYSIIYLLINSDWDRFFAGIVNLLFSALIILISVCLLRRISQRAKKAEEQSEKQEDASEETVCLNEV